MRKFACVSVNIGMFMGIRIEYGLFNRILKFFFLFRRSRMNILMCIRFTRVKIECKNVYSYRIKFNLDKSI